MLGMQRQPRRFGGWSCSAKGKVVATTGSTDNVEIPKQKPTNGTLICDEDGLKLRPKKLLFQGIE
jgi:hypothetical protein